MWYGVHRGFQLEDKNDIKHIISTRFSKERQIRHIKRCKMKEDQGGASLLYISQSQDSRDILPRGKGMTVYLDWPRHVLVSIVSIFVSRKPDAGDPLFKRPVTALDVCLSPSA
jgi:hypothetical protein